MLSYNQNGMVYYLTETMARHNALANLVTEEQAELCVDSVYNIYIVYYNHRWQSICFVLCYLLKMSSAFIKIYLHVFRFASKNVGKIIFLF